jgi:hypothetical protein
MSDYQIVKQYDNYQLVIGYIKKYDDRWILDIIQHISISKQILTDIRNAYMAKFKTIIDDNDIMNIISNKPPFLDDYKYSLVSGDENESDDLDYNHNDESDSSDSSNDKHESNSSSNNEHRFSNIVLDDVRIIVVGMNIILLLILIINILIAGRLFNWF